MDPNMRLRDADIPHLDVRNSVPLPGQPSYDERTGLTYPEERWPRALFNIPRGGTLMFTLVGVLGFAIMLICALLTGLLSLEDLLAGLGW
jgi:hypothetical protein